MTKEPTVVRAGDTLLVCVAHQQTEDEAKRFAETLRRGLPGVEVALLEGVTDLAVFRPCAPEDSAGGEGR